MKIKFYLLSILLLPFISTNIFSQNMCLTDLVIAKKVESRCPNCYALVINHRETWQNGEQIRVRFLEGDNYIQNKVIQYAEQWEQFANIDFVFGNFPNADITITFRHEGYWSYVGTQSRRHSPSMSLTGLNSRSSETEISRVVLHEFGHALGLMHEHQHANRPFEWDEEAVYRKYSGPPNNWSKEEIYSNLILKYTDKNTYTNFIYDSNSIMHYPIDGSLTKNGLSVGWNNYLSNNDKSLISRIYPSIKERTSQLIIDSPSNGTSVGIDIIMRGRTSSPQLNHYLLVVSSTAQRYFIQDKVDVFDNGAWQGRAAFGTQSYGIDHQWVIWVMTTKSHLENGKEIYLSQIPKDAVLSEPVSVIRKR